MYEPHEDQRQSFRLDVPLHQLLTSPVSERVELRPVGAPQRFPEPVFPQHPELLAPIPDDWTAPEKRRFTAGQIYGTMRGWLFPYIRSRLTGGDFHPLIAYLFTEFKCNLDCHYCWAFDNKIKGMTEDTAKRSVDWLHGTGCRVLAFMGGEGHMEVGKNIFYTVNHLCHMVLALKPFGCMPSTQSDGVQSRVVSKFKDMIFLPIETSGEGEVNAHSRVQMALAEAKAKARAEFEGVLQKTGKSLDDLREYVAEHPQLRRGLYKVPHRDGVAGTAAQFAFHVNDLMNRDRVYRRRMRVAMSTQQVA